MQTDCSSFCVRCVASFFAWVHTARSLSRTTTLCSLTQDHYLHEAEICFFLRCCCCCCAHKTRWIKQNMSAAWQPDTSGFFAPTEIPLYIYERATMNERQSQKKQNKDAQENETFFCCFLFCVIWWDEYMRLSLVANEEKKCVHHKKLEVIQVIRRNAVASMSLYTAWMPQKY